MPLRASERTRTRTAPGHQLVPASTSVPGAAVSRIVPLPPLRIPPVAQHPALASVLSSLTSPATASFPVAPSPGSPVVSSSRANTTISDVPGAILYQTQAPTSLSNIIYSTGPPPPSVEYRPRPQYNPQQTRRASKIIFHGRSDMPPHAAPLYLPPVSLRQPNLPMRTNLQLLAAQAQYPGHFDRNPHFQSQLHVHHAYSGHAERRALSAW
ncbi:hypothetical protein B0H14DRAFT_546681 [Mycena olivaceomarginata]|nr:hypothetical protein B0H14DRAFT_546681 [Mycena olivaceomarginata]